jgi:hypothetical protein
MSTTATATSRNIVCDSDDEVSLNAAQSAVFRELLDLAIAAATNDGLRAVLQSVRSQVGDGPSLLVVATTDFHIMLTAVEAQVSMLVSPDDQTTARSFLVGWDKCRNADNGTKIIITQ